MSRSHHFHVHLSKKKQKNLLDKVVSVAAFVCPLSGLPQVYYVFMGHTDGVSVISWVLFALFSALFLVYGLVHKIKPMITINILWIIVDILVILGTISHRMIR